MSAADAAFAPGFDRRRFAARLTTHALGRTLVVRDATASTNDDLWDALQAGAPAGLVVVAEAQTRGRGRDGRVWHTAPGRGLALSVALEIGCGPDVASSLPLVIGLALAEGLERLGVETRLKWPNDVLLQGRKLAGVLCERRRLPIGDLLVAGVGVNVSERLEDLAPELRDAATSLAIAGRGDLGREDVAAEFLNALEPRFAAHEEGGPQGALAAWTRRAAFWGDEVRVRTPAGERRGVARALDLDGALVIEEPGGARVRVLAGDLAPEAARS